MPAQPDTLLNLCTEEIQGYLLIGSWRFIPVNRCLTIPNAGDEASGWGDPGWALHCLTLFSPRVNQCLGKKKKQYISIPAAVPVCLGGVCSGQTTKSSSPKTKPAYWRRTACTPFKGLLKPRSAFSRLKSEDFLDFGTRAWGS
ncbi:hypothetical protein BJX68DRAFT_46238 [Aspergillus pseudodeflectus]|uniref:Uncharacterized protein n=1 Tax=Aspergillus pseudodeflectus TaxID=176178 RepID=A0ABR4KPK7_9EURO